MIPKPDFPTGVAMSCVIGRGYFEEVGRFGSRIYKNNELSQILREGHPTTLKSTIGFVCVLSLFARCNGLTITIFIAVMRPSGHHLAFWMPPRAKARSARTIKSFPLSISHLISPVLSSNGWQGPKSPIVVRGWVKPCNSSMECVTSMSRKV